ncbi:MAG: GMC family oxidoreductase [Halobacteriales archaeon]
MSERNETYDYVIVGAGAAGCVLANRLTEHSDDRVLLLEAGSPDDRREISVPAGYAELLQSSVDWEYYTTPQPNLDDRSLYWPRGKTYGGSTSINAMIFVRGAPTDYDHWESLGNDGWGWEDVQPYYERLEHFEGGPAIGRGTDGPLNIAEEVPYPHELSEAFMASCDTVSIPHADGFNNGQREGVSLYEVTQKDRERHSVADAYLKPALTRSTLEARTECKVTRIRFDGTRAVGVTYEHDGDRINVDVEKEVIVCAGAIESPKLLLLSGIGPSDQLQTHGIDVVTDSPGVGRNLQDHLSYRVNWRLTEPISFAGADNLWNLVKYLLLKRGPFTSNGVETGAFLRTDPDLPAPDVRINFSPVLFLDHPPDPDDHGMHMTVSQQRPKSRGEITLQSADPDDDPNIDPNYLDHEDDLSVLVAGIKRAREIARAEPLDAYCGEELLPGPDAETDAEIAERIRENALTDYHPVGTCKMGDGEFAVVDDRLRVRGVDDLRVVDASIMPTIDGGNPMATTVMIAEKASDFIRGKTP